jgi:alginate O-acetyltransferase complex protein AlgI
MLIGGLWHGASWTFLAWGAYHGVLLIAYKRFGGVWDPLPVVVRRPLMFVAVVVGWVFFRSSSFSMAGDLFATMFWPTSGIPFPGAATLAVVVAFALTVVHCARNTWHLPHRWSFPTALALSAGFALSLVVTYGFHLSPFLYFQF